MTVWLVAVIALLPGVAMSTVIALRADLGNRLAAVQLAGCLAAFTLAAMTFAFDQSTFVDLALCLALLSLPGTWLMSLFVERWL